MIKVTLKKVLFFIFKAKLVIEITSKALALKFR